VAGLIGIPGAAGVFVATPVGRWVDRRGPGPAVLAGALSVSLAYAAFGFAALTVAAVVVGAMLLDIGIRASLVANQAYIAGIDASARARTNMLFMVHAFAGNGVGAFLASEAFNRAGWRGVVIVGLTSALGAASLHLAWRSDRTSSLQQGRSGGPERARKL
jgi:predicted MFS family arabinose efflux permease